MFQLLETIKIKNGIPENIEFHNERFNRTRRDLFKITEYCNLGNCIASEVDNADGIYKCRILYGKMIENIQIIPYKIKEIHTIKIIEDNNIQYDYKFENREKINHLYAQKNECDDILIVKNGFVTDTSYCNIIFKRDDKLYTPNTPLLKGTKRAKLIKEAKVSEKEIKITDIKLFQKALLINAMIDLDDKVEISIDKII
jgi:4-amino-4-deoxychorismate lyase